LEAVNDPEVIKSASLTAWVLGFGSPANKKVFATFGLIRNLLLLLERFSDNSPMVFAILGALYSQSFDVVSAVGILAKEDCAHLVKLLIRFEKDDKIETQILSVVANFFAVDKDVRTYFRDTALTKVVYKIISSENVTVNSAPFILQLLEGYALDSKTTNKIGFQDPDKIVLHIAERFHADEKVKERAFRALTAFAGTEEARVAVCNSFVWNFCAAEVLNQMDNDVVFCRACETMSAVSGVYLRDDDMEKDADKVLSLMSEALRLYSSKSNVMKALCGAVSAYLRRPRFRNFVRSNSIVDILVDLFESYTIDSIESISAILECFTALARSGHDGRVLIRDSSVLEKLVFFMNTHWKHRENFDLNAIGTFIAAATAENPENNAQLGVLGVCELVVQMLQEYRKDEDEAISAALKSIAALAVLDRNLGIMIEEGLIDTIVPMLSSKAKSPIVLDGLGRVIGSLSMYPELMEMLNSSGVVRILGNACQKYWDQPCISGISQAFAVISSQGDSAQQLGGLGACDCLVLALTKVSQADDDFASISDALAALTVHHPNAHRVATVELFEALSRCLLKRHGNSGVSLSICKLIRKVVLTKHHQALCKQSKIPESIVAALANSGIDHKVVGSICKTIDILIHDNGELLETFVNLDVSSHLRQCLERNTSHADICNDIFETIGKFSEVEKYVKHFGSPEMCTSVAKVLITNFHSLDVSKSASHVISNLVAGNGTRSAEAFNQANVMETMVELIRAHFSDFDALHLLLKTTLKLIENYEGNVKSICKSTHLVRTLMVAIRHWSSKVKITADICLLLARVLEGNTFMLQAMEESDAKHIAIVLIETFSTTNQVLQGALQLVAQMYFAHLKLKTIISDRRDCEAVVKVMQTFISDHSVLRECFRVVCASKSSENIQIFGELGVCELIAKAVNEAVLTSNCEAAETILPAITAMCSENQENAIRFGTSADICSGILSMYRLFAIKFEGDTLNILVSEAIAVLCAWSRSNRLQCVSTNVDKLTNSGAVELLKDFVENGRGLSSCAKALSSIALGKLGTQKVINCGLCELVAQKLATLDAKESSSTTGNLAKIIESVCKYSDEFPIAITQLKNLNVHVTLRSCIAKLYEKPIESGEGASCDEDIASCFLAIAALVRSSYQMKRLFIEIEMPLFVSQTILLELKSKRNTVAFSLIVLMSELLRKHKIEPKALSEASAIFLSPEFQQSLVNFALNVDAPAGAGAIVLRFLAVRWDVLASAGEHSDLFSEESAKIVCDIYRSHRGDFEVALAFNMVLNVFCKQWIVFEANQREEIGATWSHHFCPLLVMSLFEYAESTTVDLLQLALYSFLVLLPADPVNAKAFCDCDASAAIMTIMEKHLSNAALMELSCKALHSVAQCIAVENFSDALNSGLCRNCCLALSTDRLSLEAARPMVELALLLLSKESNIQGLTALGLCENLITVFKKFGSDAALCSKVSVAIEILLNIEANLDVFSKPSLLSSLGSFVESFGGQECAMPVLEVVASLGEVQKNREYFTEIRVAEAIAKIFATNVPVERTILLFRVVDVLSTKAPKNAEIFGQHFICEMTVDIIGRLQDNEEVVTSGLAALASLSISPSNKRRIGRDGCSQMCAMMAKYRSNSVVVYTALDAIQEIVRNNKDVELYFEGSHIGRDIVSIGEASIDDAEQIIVVVTAIESLLQSSLLQRIGEAPDTGADETEPFVLPTFREERSNGASSISDELVSSGVLDFLANILEFYSRDANVISPLCRSLEFLSKLYNSSSSDSNIFSTYSDLYRNIVLALNLHYGTRKVNVSICSCIRAIAARPENRVPLQAVGVCELLGAALEHSLSVDDMRFASVVLDTIVAVITECPDNQARCGSIGVCVTVSDLVGRDLVDVNLTAASLRAAAALAKCGATVNTRNLDNIEILYEAGVLALAIDILKSSNDELDLLVAACHVIGSFAAVDDIVTEMLESRVVDTLHALGKRLLRSEPICTAVATAGLGIVHELTLDILLECRFHEMLMHMLQKHQNCEELIVLVFKYFIKVVIMDSDTSKTFSRIDILETVILNMKRFAASEEVSYVLASFMARLVNFSTDAQLMLGRFGACEALVNCLRQQLLRPRVAEACIKCIRRLCANNPMNANRVRMAGGDELIEQSRTLTQDVWVPAEGNTE
jgi:hypothetical protein